MSQLFALTVEKVKWIEREDIRMMAISFKFQNPENLLLIQNIAAAHDTLNGIQFVWAN